MYTLDYATYPVPQGFRKKFFAKIPNEIQALADFHNVHILTLLDAWADALIWKARPSNPDLEPISTDFCLTYDIAVTTLERVRRSPYWNFLAIIGYTYHTGSRLDECSKLIKAITRSERDDPVSLPR